MLPGHTLASINDQQDGMKKAKDRVTINACENASGTIKLPQLFIGKSKNPCCFQNLNKELGAASYLPKSKKCLGKQ